ncbi:prophage tail fiber N-terminal domain-containing protein [Escherichia coli]|uniref:prophage tail fiber N-terminal domain-containing protein n=1 Tax=Escherichia coli TaxID=562 RepID=UPI002952EC79|nr:prophage tail fiber N-terminal domain-containing protein [Escherichia coli]CAK0748301.1 prophage tail fiber N-terminal domain-containing protein [Escherichia coli]
MSVLISGVLKDGTGKPVQGCTIVLKAKRTTDTVIVNTLASENPDEAGRYSMNVEPGRYAVSLFIEGYPPSYAGDITVYADSPPGTLNYFLGTVSEDDLRPDVLKRFEEIASEINRLAEEVRKKQQQVSADTEKVSNAASKVQQAERSASEHAESARNSAISSATSERDAALHAKNAQKSAQDAERNAQQTGQHLQAAKTASEEAKEYARQAGASKDTAGEHAEKAKKYAEEIKSQGEKANISADKKNILVRLGDGLFVNGAHPLIPKMGGHNYTTTLNNFRSLPDGTRVYSLSIGVSNPLNTGVIGGYGIVIAPIITPRYLYLDEQKKCIPAQYLMDSVTATASEIKIALKVVLTGKPQYAVDVSDLETREEGDGSGNIGCKLSIRILAGTTLRQNGIS